MASSLPWYREDARYDVLIEGIVSVGRQRTPIHVINVSRSGALCQAPVHPPAGTDVLVAVAATLLPARVAWARGERFGIVFHHPVGEAWVHMLVMLGPSPAAGRHAVHRTVQERLELRPRPTYEHPGAGVGGFQLTHHHVRRLLVDLLVETAGSTQERWHDLMEIKAAPITIGSRGNWRVKVDGSAAEQAAITREAATIRRSYPFVYFCEDAAD